MDSHINLGHFTKVSPDKERNGDFCDSAVLEDGNLIVMALGDGVGSSPCDWKASKMICQGFIQYFSKLQDPNLKERFREALLKANEGIVNQGGNCLGMKSTFCGLVWDLGSEKIFYTNLGDSRIYARFGSGLKQISTDHVKAIIRRHKDGKPIMISGTPVIAEGVTKVVGIVDPHILIKEENAQNLEAIFMTSDGFHSLGNQFEEDAVAAINSVELSSGLEGLYTKYRDAQKDDMTILAARKNTSGKEIEQILKDLLEQHALSSSDDLKIAQALLLGLERFIVEKETDYSLRLIESCKERNIDLGRTNIGNLLTKMREADFQSGEVYSGLRDLLMSSRYD